MRLQIALLRARSFLITALVLTLITAALLIGVARLAFPYVERFEPEVSQWLSARVGGPVTIGSIEGEWTSTGPRLLLHDLIIGDEKTALAFSEADVSLDMYAWLWPRSANTTALRLHADQIDLERQLDGSIRISGLAAGNVMSDPDGSNALRAPGSWVMGAQLAGDVSVLTYSDLETGHVLNWDDVQIRFRGDGEQIKVQLAADQAERGLVRLTAHLEARDGRLEWLRFHLIADSLELQSELPDTRGAWPEIVQGKVSIEAWGDRVDGVSGSMAADDLVLAARSNVNTDAGPLAPRFSADRLATRFDWRPGESGWQVGLADLEVDRLDSSITGGKLMVRSKETELDVTAQGVRLQDLSALAVVFGHLSPKLREQIYGLSPSGLMREVRVQLDRDEGVSSLKAEAAFQDLALLATGSIPGMTGISGELSHYQGTGALRLAGSDAVLTVPSVLHDPLYADDLSIDATWQQTAAGLKIDLSNFAFENSGLEMDGRLQLLLEADQSKPKVDLAARISRLDVAQLHRFLPYSAMRARTLAWLKKSLLEGEGTDGRVVIRGDMDDWPFMQDQGRFQAILSLDGVGIDYNPNWPAVYGMDARLEFKNAGLSVQAYSGTAHGSQITSSIGTIARLGPDPLIMDIAATGDGANWLEFIDHSPLGKTYAPYLLGMTLDGPSDLDLRLEIPFAPNSRIGVDGRFNMNEVDYADPKWGLKIDEMQGPLVFDAGGFLGSELAATYDGEPVEVTMAAGSMVDEPQHSFTASMVGPINPRALIDVESLNPWLDRLEGRAQWSVDLSVERSVQTPSLVAGEDSGGLVTVAMSSDMRGTHIRLPAPMGKRADQSLPISVTTSLPIERAGLTMDYGGICTLRYHPLTADDPRGTVTCGDEPSVQEMPSIGVRLTGDLPDVDVDGWDDALVELAPDDGSANTLFERVDVQVADLFVFGRTFKNVGVAGVAQRRIWDLAVSGEGLEGTLRLPFQMDRQSTVDAQFQRLEWPDSDDPEHVSVYQPADAPTLHFYAESLRFGEAELGSVRLETYPTDEGMRIDRLETLSEAMSMQAKGNWNGASGLDRSRFDITITAENLGEMLTELGFNGMVDGGQTLLTVDADWPGRPTDFGLNSLGGSLDIAVGQGQFLDLEPGAGRFFGLLSLQAIPRRLILDFADVFKSGLTFDSINGSFALDSGEAFTDNLTIKGPSADIFVYGRTGLAAQDYDQRITVVPSVGETLPLVGALAGGGPAAAAALLVVQNVFGKQISQMTQLQYHVTGSWSEPEVEQVRATSPSQQGG